MGINWVDGVVVLIVVYHLVDGWKRGFISLVVHLISFLTSLYLAVRFHLVVGNFLVQKFAISPRWVDVLGYIVVAFVSQIIIDEIGSIIIRNIPVRLTQSKINYAIGSVVSILTGLVTVSFILLLILSLPLRGTIKQDIASSRVGRALVVAAEGFGKPVKSSLDGITKEAIKFLTIEPSSGERLNLELPSLSATLSVDRSAEISMVTRVNAERRANGLPSLEVDEEITEVARAKSKDMFEHHYFSHTDYEGKSAGDRLIESDIGYMIVGENLAYAPDTDSAHQGLMDSPGHRANILEPRFHHVGIGVIDGGIYGKMFTQIFTD